MPLATSAHVHMDGTLATELGSVKNESVRAVVNCLATASIEIANVARGGFTQHVHSQNEFGDEQLELDVRADSIIMTHLKACAAVATASSEENAREIEVNSSGTLSVAFDPLDGSSIIPCNWAVGSIVRYPPRLRAS